MAREYSSPPRMLDAARERGRALRELEERQITRLVPDPVDERVDETVVESEPGLDGGPLDGRTKLLRPHGQDHELAVSARLRGL
jgi:hypothetical protein